MKKRGTAWIGTSNIVVPGNKTTYPEAFREKSRLNYYSSIFNSLEINSSFYKVPMADTFKKWANDVNGQFRFSVKLFKEITHVKELKYDPGIIPHFLECAGKLSNTVGCLLVQFPGKITFDYFTEVENILESIFSFDDDLRVAVEFRNATWYTAETFELLDEYNASFVLHDIPKSRNEKINKKAGFVYIRFHGPTGNYRGSYSDEALQDYGDKINAWLRQGKDVYAYFNNTMGNALENAIALQTFLKNK